MVVGTLGSARAQGQPEQTVCGGLRAHGRGLPPSTRVAELAGRLLRNKNHNNISSNNDNDNGYDDDTGTSTNISTGTSISISISIIP